MAMAAVALERGTEAAALVVAVAAVEAAVAAGTDTGTERGSGASPCFCLKHLEHMFSRSFVLSAWRARSNGEEKSEIRKVKKKRKKKKKTDFFVATQKFGRCVVRCDWSTQPPHP
jgi:hypothetical protein